jgi:hypothetical protein
MNATRVSNRAWRKPGMAITIILLGLIALRQGKAAEINYTITGVLTGGWDQLGIFATGKDAMSMGGKPFTLVFTFDDSKGKDDSNKQGSGISGSGRYSGGKAVLTMGAGSYTFGGDKYSGWAVYRSPTLITIVVNEARGSFFDFAPSVDLMIMPANGGTRFGSDWKAPLSTTQVDNQTSCFFIRRLGVPGHEVKGCFDVRKVEVVGPKSWWPF